MRAKLVLSKIQPSGTSENLTFNAVTEKPFDNDGASEDNDFARWTPSATLTMNVANPNLVGKFKEGQKFYVDFTTADS